MTIPRSIVSSSSAKTVARLIEPDWSRCNVLKRWMHIRHFRLFAIGNKRRRSGKRQVINVGGLFDQRTDDVARAALVGTARQQPPGAGQQGKLMSNRDAHLISPANLVGLEVAF